ncbi:MAG: lipoprotein insertase outer membrane protein LolB [Gallionellaceae bacterium]|nr:lipoprotein insertase outer membrane protein LolB [Gallionellaceae bacterium]
MPFLINGRIAIQHNKQRHSATLRWAHNAQEDEILLFAPLGQTVARIQRNAVEVMLDTSDQHYVAHDAEELTQQALGWRLPLAGLQYWILALPAPGAAYTTERDANGQTSVLYQDGWTVRYPRYATTALDSLPLHLVLQREELEIRLLIDGWEI